MGRVDEGCSNLLGVLVGTLGVLCDGLELSTLLLASLLEFLGDGITLLGLLPEKNTRDLCCANAEEQEVDGSKATIDTVSTLTTQKFKEQVEYTYKRFLGLMTKHQRVQIKPVAMRAPFCESESDSTGRAKSAAPARTRPHFMMGAQKWTVLGPTGEDQSCWRRD
jgi:hypothetical protein